MQRKERRVISLTDKHSNFITYEDFSSSIETNECDISRMKKILREAMLDELTDKQRYCVCQYYLLDRSMKSIAEELNVRPSTVTRHIQSAKNRLKRVAKYY